MVPFSMTLNDLWRIFQCRSLFSV